MLTSVYAEEHGSKKSQRPDRRLKQGSDILQKIGEKEKESKWRDSSV
jgi:hypothetical protein